MARETLARYLIGDSRRGSRIGNAVRDSYDAMRGIVARCGPTGPAEC